VSIVALGLWAAGLVLIGLAIWRARPAQARLGELDRLAENASRYDSWRGGRKTAVGADGPSGADLMRDMLRRQVRLWVAVGAAGVFMLVAGFVLR
jgi:hypothetical protein